MPLGNYFVGNGNISAYTVNANVFGTNTTFTTQLQSGAAIANASNVFIGYVSYIVSNTSLVLTANANINTTTSNAYNIATYTANVANVIYNCNGNITASTLNNLVFGNSSSFTKNLKSGDKIYAAGYPSGSDQLIGWVSLIVDDYSLMLTGNSAANVTNNQFYRVSSSYTYSPVGNTQRPRDFNAGRNAVDSALFDWTNSGLGSTVSYVHKYHPPVRDSMTGIYVHLPAMIYENQQGNRDGWGKIDRLTGNIVGNVTTSTSVLKTYDKTLGTASTPDFVIKDFDHHDYPFGTDVSHVHRHLVNAPSIKKLTDSDSDDDFIKARDSLIPNTVVHGFGYKVKANVNLVTDTLENTRDYFSRVGKTEQLKDEGDINFGSNQDLRLRPMPIELKKTVATGAPIAIPGLLNIKVITNEPTDTVWQPYKYRPTYLGNVNYSPIHSGNIRYG